MTNIDFYILSATNIEQRHVFACRLTEKAYKLGHRIYIHTQDQQQADDINNLLWTFRNSSFIPHSNIGDGETLPSSMVLVGYGLDEHEETQKHHDVMINLSHQVPDFFSRFDRVSEIVIENAEIKVASRDNYRFYKTRGYPLTNRHID